MTNHRRQHDYDLAVVGGGINGVGIARDATGRGLRVLLIERGDLASATSQWSSKLIHGGLRYLEHGEFSLVREALRERELLLDNAPHLVRPMRFVLPVGPDTRPAWVLRLGLLIYDVLSGASRLPQSERIDLRYHEHGAPIRREFRTAFAYSDCFVDDARLVVLNARDAAERGCEVRTRTACVEAKRSQGGWHLTLRGQTTPESTATTETVGVKAIVNACGPWTRRFLDQIGIRSRRSMRWIKGSHIVVPRLHSGDNAYLLQNDDRRIVFVIPFQNEYSLIGTTEVAVDDASDPQCSDDEAFYLCRAVSRYFAIPVTAESIVWRYAGVRPLFDDGSNDPAAITRDYVFEVDQAAGAPILSVFGGKLTTYRCLGEKAVDRLAPWFPSATGPWTAAAPLPGADLPPSGVAGLQRELVTAYPRIPQSMLQSLVDRHGSDARAMLASWQGSLGSLVGRDLSQAEADWLIEHEWAVSEDDLLWRRTKAGLRRHSPGPGSR